MEIQQEEGIEQEAVHGALLLSGDNLRAHDRRELEAWFKCRVHNAYVSQESGFLAIQCDAGGGMHVIPARGVIEIVDDDGVVREEGAGELVVTTLDNRAMPFIRYRTGDVGRIENGVRCSRCGHEGQTILSIDGRNSTYFRVGRRKINPSILNGIFESPELHQFRLTQLSERHFHLEWVARAGSAPHERLESELARRICEAIGDIEIEIECLRTIGVPGEKVQRYVSKI